VPAHWAGRFCGVLCRTGAGGRGPATRRPTYRSPPRASSLCLHSLRSQTQAGRARLAAGAGGVPHLRLSRKCRRAAARGAAQDRDANQAAAHLPGLTGVVRADGDVPAAGVRRGGAPAAVVRRVPCGGADHRVGWQQFSIWTTIGPRLSVCSAWIAKSRPRPPDLALPGVAGGSDRGRTATILRIAGTSTSPLALCSVFW